MPKAEDDRASADNRGKSDEVVEARLQALLCSMPNSANATPPDLEGGLKAGFFRYITNIIKFNQLIQALDVAPESAGRSSCLEKT